VEGSTGKPERVWFVTGAGAGFGRAITEAASVAGDVVVAAARRPEALAALAAEHSGRIAPIHLDVTDTEQFALEGYSEALAAEVAPFGIRVLIVEPGAFRTGFAGPALVESAVIDAYDHTVGASRSYIKGVDGIQPGDPAKAATAILTALAVEQPPLRLALGDDAVDSILGHLDAVRTQLHDWEHLSRDTGYEG
jgi:NAD(P)-dependent dehydrogenase (short-subunit alcohol dehydrogenase family)